MESEAYSYLEDRFGVTKEDFEGLELREKNDDIWLASEHSSDFEAETVGIRAVRNMSIGFKPTTYLLQYLGSSIERNIVDIREEEFLKLLRREEMVEREMSEKGYVALRFNGRIVGCGFYMDEKVSSRIPKGRSEELADILVSAT